MTVTRRTATVTSVTFAHLPEIPPQPVSCWCHVNCSFALMARHAGNSAGLVAYLERIAMRNALGLMLASVLAAVVIAGGWYFYSSRADQGAPKTTAARAADPLPAPAKLAARDDVETTAGLAGKPAAPAAVPAPTSAAAPVQQTSTCTNPNALGVSRVVEIDTTGGPGFGFEQFKQFDFLADKEVVLTFDDGPWPHNTPAVLKALAD